MNKKTGKKSGHTEEEQVDTDIEIEEEYDSTHGLDAAGLLKKLKKQLAACRKERDEYLDGWQRARADFANARREEGSRVEAARAEGKKDIIFEILPALDSFDMAFSGDSWERVDTAWRTGIEYIYAQLLASLERAGVTQTDPAGEVFDPSLHESVEQVPTRSTEQGGRIVEVVQKGYMLHDSVLRPARVKVYTLTNAQHL